MMKHKIILGLGDDKFNKLIKEDLEGNELGHVVADVITRNVIVKRVMETEATLLFIGEDLVGAEQTEEEWIAIIEELRRISLSLRIVFFCERPASDMFLSKLTTLYIHDIFHEGKLPQSYVEQLQRDPAYKNTEQFRGGVNQIAMELAEKTKELQAEEIMSKGVSMKSKLSNFIESKKKDAPHSDEEPTVRVKTVKVVEIVEKPVPVEVRVPVYDKVFIRPQFVAVASAFPLAGSSLFIKMLAEYLQNLGLGVAIVESATSPSAWYEMIGAEEVVKDDIPAWRSWHDVLLHEEDVEGDPLEVEGINYFIRHPQDDLNGWDIMNTAHLIGYARQFPILLYDLSHDLHQEHHKLSLRQTDQVVLVTGFDPPRVNRYHGQYRQLLETTLRGKLTLVANKSTAWLSKEQSSILCQSYGVSEVHSLPLLQSLHNVYVSGGSVWNNPFLKEEEMQLLKPIFEKVAIDILTEDLYKKLATAEKKGSIWSKWMHALKPSAKEIEAEEGTA